MLILKEVSKLDSKKTIVQDENGNYFLLYSIGIPNELPELLKVTVTKKDVTKVLTELGIPKEHQMFLSEAIFLLTQNDCYVKSMQSYVYPTVAAKKKTTPVHVQSNCIYAVSLCNTTTHKYVEIFNTTKKVRPKIFMSLVAKYVTGQ